MFVYELPTLLKDEKVYEEQTLVWNSIVMILLFVRGNFIYCSYQHTVMLMDKFTIQTEKSRVQGRRRSHKLTDEPETHQ